MKTILLVEDEPILRKSIVRFLQKKRYEVLAAADQEEACSYLEKEPIDILITDLVLPKGTGFALLEEAEKRGAGLKAIVITAYGSPEVKERLSRLEIFGYLDKPFELEALTALVETAFSTEAQTGGL